MSQKVSFSLAQRELNKIIKYLNLKGIRLPPLVLSNHFSFTSCNVNSKVDLIEELDGSLIATVAGILPIELNRRVRNRLAVSSFNDLQSIYYWEVDGFTVLAQSSNSKAILSCIREDGWTLFLGNS